MPRPSTIRQLPPEIKEQVDRLLREGRFTIDDILSHLKTLGADISRSAVGRYKQKYEASLQRYREAQEVAAVWVNKLGEDPQGDVGRLIAEMLKTVAFQTLAQMGEEDASATPMDIMLLAKAIKDVEAAGKYWLDRELKVKAALKEKVDARIRAAEAELRAPGAAGGDAQAVLKRIREDVYGIFA